MVGRSANQVLIEGQLHLQKVLKGLLITGGATRCSNTSSLYIVIERATHYEVVVPVVY